MFATALYCRLTGKHVAALGMACGGSETWGKGKGRPTSLCLSVWVECAQCLGSILAITNAPVPQGFGGAIWSLLGLWSHKKYREALSKQGAGCVVTCRARGGRVHAECWGNSICARNWDVAMCRMQGAASMPGAVLLLLVSSSHCGSALQHQEPNLCEVWGTGGQDPDTTWLLKD